MYLISRIYVGNFGVQSSWYDGLVLSFKQSEDQSPSDKIIHLRNGGGKSTLLSAVFMNFDPREKRFLKSLQNSAHKMSDYFDQSGLPAFIAIEWEAKDRSKGTRKIVTGQAAALRRNFSTTLDRHFFHFESTPQLNFDTLPFPNLVSEPVTSMIDFAAWLRKQSCEPSLFASKRQSDWESTLRTERGLDIDMLRLQLDLSKLEGGVDAFLDFKSEIDFLNKFFDLTIERQEADKVRIGVLLACEKLRDKPRLDRQREVVVQCRNLLGALAEKSSECLTARTELQKAKDDAFDLAIRLKRSIVAAETKLEQMKLAKADLQVEVQDKQQQLAQQRSKRDAIQFVKLEFSLAHNRSRYRQTESELETIKTTLELVRAARDLKACNEAQLSFIELDKAVELAREKLLPILQQTEQQGYVLRCALDSELNRLQKACDETTEIVRRKKAEIDVLSDEQIAMREFGQELTTKLASYDFLIGQMQAKRIQLVSKGLLDADENTEVAIQRKMARATGLESTGSQLRESLAKSERQFNLLNSELKGLKDAALDRERTFQEVQRRAEEGERAEQLLQESEILRQLCESELPDLNSPTLLEALIKRISEAQVEQGRCAVSKAALATMRESIDATGLAAANSDTETVVRYLIDNGIRSAKPYPHYIAEIWKQPAEARKAFENNPFRAIGVALQDLQDLQQAKSLLCKFDRDISQPVMVSSTSDESNFHDASCAVVSPSDDSLFNFDAAAQRRISIVEDIALGEARISELHEEYESLLKCKTDLVFFRTKYGAGKMQLLFDEVDAAHATVRSACEVVATAESEIKATSELIESYRELLSANATEIATVASDLEKLQTFVNDFEAPSIAGNSAAQGWRQQQKQNTDQIEAHEQQIGNLREDISNLGTDVKLWVAETERLREEFGKVTYHSTDFELVADQPLAVARELYQAKLWALKSAEDENYGPLALKLEAARTRFAEMKAAFERQHGHLLLSDVEQQLCIDHEREEHKLSRDRATCESAKVEALADLNMSDRDLRAFNDACPAAKQDSQTYSHLSTDELHEAHRAVDLQIRELETTLADLSMECSRLEENCRTCQHRLELLRTNFRVLDKAFDKDDLIVPVELEESDESDVRFESLELEVIGDQIEMLAKAARSAQKRADKALRAVEGEHTILLLYCKEAAFTDLEPALADQLSQHTVEDAMQHVEEHLEHLEERLATIDSLLSAMSKEFESIREDLSLLTCKGADLLKQACAYKLPEGIDFIGGKSVINLKRGVLNEISIDTTKAQLSHFLDRIIDTNNSYEKGTELLTAALMYLLPGGLGLQLVKLVPDHAEQYCQIDKLKVSGAEGVSMAMFLYLLICKVRSESRGERHLYGGPLVLDNPFAKAQSSFVWRGLRELAQSLHVQLIIATAIKDYNSLAEFEHFIRLKNESYGSKSKRRYVQLAEMSFNQN